MSRENDIDKWIIRNAAKKEQQSRVVPTAADQLTSADPSRGEAAIENVASWIGAERNLPAVELAQVSPVAVKVTFIEPVMMPDPWINEHNEAESDTWALTHDQAMSLPRSQVYGDQMTSLTGLGNIVDGRRIFASTARWGLLNIAGTADWVESLMIGQVMNQAAEPWSADCNIWLVGFGETAEKLTSFLSSYHPIHRFRTVDRVSEINAEEITQSTATVYVRNAENEDKAEILALSEAPEVGIIADRILSERHMFLTEGEDGSAVMGPFERDLEVYPNIAPEAVEAMEAAWEAQEAYAEEVVAAADFSQLLRSDDESNDSVSDSSSEPASAVEESPEIPPRPSTPPPAFDDGEGEDEVAEEPDQDATDSSDAVQEDETPAAPATGEIELHLLGDLRAITESGEVTGRNALALALLSFSAGPVPAQEMSERLWPGDDAAGHTARTRRSRLLSALREKAGASVTTDEDGWVLTTPIASDFHSTLQTLGTDPSVNEEQIIATCDSIDTPLADNTQWTQERDTMREQLRKALHELKGRAVESEAYDVAKAVKRAEDKLEG
jgi:hypothetical protein